MSLHTSVLNESIKTIETAHGRIIHCLNQLDDSQIWHRPHNHVNSIGIILQHLCGNLRQWVISGIGKKSDVRRRPLEFQDSQKTSKNAIAAELEKTIEKCKETIRQIKEDELLAPRRIQGFDETVLSAMYSTIPHLELHAGQITYITRMMTKEKYRLHWKPKTKEEGAE